MSPDEKPEGARGSVEDAPALPNESGYVSCGRFRSEGGEVAVSVWRSSPHPTRKLRLRGDWLFAPTSRPPEVTGEATLDGIPVQRASGEVRIGYTLGVDEASGLRHDGRTKRWSVDLEVTLSEPHPPPPLPTAPSGLPVEVALGGCCFLQKHHPPS